MRDTATMPLPDPTATGPACSTEARLSDWAEHPALARARANLFRGTTQRQIVAGTLVTTGIAAADVDAYRLVATRDTVDGGVDTSFDEELLATALLSLAHDMPDLPVRSAIGWLFAVLGDRGLGNPDDWNPVDPVWDLGGDGAVASVRIVEWQHDARGYKADLAADWLLLAAGVSPAEVADRGPAIGTAPLDEDALYAMAALRGCPTPAR